MDGKPEIANQQPGERVLSASRRTCEWCHKEFEPLRDWQRFDSDKCRKAAFDAPTKAKQRATLFLKTLKEMVGAHGCECSICQNAREVIEYES